MRISVLSVFKSVFLLLVLAAVGAGGYKVYSNLPRLLNELASKPEQKAVPPGQDVIVTIPKGSSLSQVGDLLYSKGVISSRLVFKLVGMIRGEQCKIKAGDYLLKTDSDVSKVLDLLISGKTLMFSVTVPEGYNLMQISDLFQKRGIMQREEFLKIVRDPATAKEFGLEGTTLEGYLFPDTYFFRPSDLGNGKKIIGCMISRFKELYDHNVRGTAEKYGWSQYQVVTLASLIEKEARASEHRLISAVFHNRLRKNMRLQSDPTVIYGIKAMGSKITRADLNRKHPYNTYVNAGLPPGPIANPGKASLIAAVQPEDKPYLYFVAKNDGTHHFSTTLKEHNAAVNKYQRSGRSVREKPSRNGREMSRNATASRAKSPRSN